jgi:hypothetical protein
VPADNEDAPEPLYCTTCDRRAAKPVAGLPFCLKCIHDGAKRNPLVFPLPDDPYLRHCAIMLLTAS